MTGKVRWATAALAVSRRLRRTTPRELLTLARAAVTLILVEATIRILPVERATALWGVPLALEPTDSTRPPLPQWELPANSARGLRAAHRVSLLWPFADGPCLRRSILGGHMIRDLDPVLRLGYSATKAGAHAWIEIDGRPLEDVSDFVAFQRRTNQGAA